MNSILITATELRALRDRPVIFDCRFSLADPAQGRRAYLDAHVPGATHLDMERDLAGAKNGRNGRHPLPERAALQATLGAAGVDSDSTVVLYDANRLAGAARAWWLLRYFGMTGTAAARRRLHRLARRWLRHRVRRGVAAVGRQGRAGRCERDNGRRPRVFAGGHQRPRRSNR